MMNEYEFCIVAHNQAGVSAYSKKQSDRLQVTNECGTATSSLDILVQTVPSLQITSSGEAYVNLVSYTCSKDSESELQ
ncbi:unnamed protein product [Rotaria sordida]|uniref:Uncharacterized protein n=1 Tax=Rotaria sordida TaxID=392033 RepID=A0A819K8C9_9BILA|nr:unnamed protein product [Rotaria sordida]CAF3943901.1 unnamed protein product [Rotaria sordida]